MVTKQYLPSVKATALILQSCYRCGLSGLLRVVLLVGLALGVSGCANTDVPTSTASQLETTEPSTTQPAILTNTIEPGLLPTDTVAPISTTAQTIVARPAPGEDRYFITGPTLAEYAVGDLLAVYAKDVAGLEFDVAVVAVIDQNADNLIVQVIFRSADVTIDSLAALRIDDQLETVNLEQMIPAASVFAGFVLDDATIRLIPNAGVKVGDTLEAVQLTAGGDAISFATGPILLRIDSLSVNRTVARVATTATVPPAGTLLVLPADAPPTTPAPEDTTEMPTTSDPPTPEAQVALPIYESFAGAGKLPWEAVQGEWGINNQRLQVRRFPEGKDLAAISIPPPTQRNYVLQLDFGTIKHLDDSGNVNVPFSYFHVIVRHQGGNDGYWFTVTNGGVACTKYVDDVGTRLSPPTTQWGEMQALLLRTYTGDHEMEISVRGQEYSFVLDGTQVCNFRDDTYGEGGLVVAVSNGASGQMWIDDVRIVALD